MNKLISAALAAGTALLCLTGCGNKFVGEWETVKVEYDGETYRSSNFEELEDDYSIGKFMEIEIEKDGTGNLQLDGGRYDIDFEWEADDDEITFELEDKLFDQIDELEGKLDDDELVIDFKLGYAPITVYLSQDDEDDDDDDDDDNDKKGSYASKSRLKSANSSAKLVFTTVFLASADIIADGGDLSQIYSLSYPKRVSNLDTSNKVEKAVYDAIRDNGDDTDSYVYWEIDSNYNITFAQFTENGSVVGQYPDPETDPENEHDIGYKF